MCKGAKQKNQVPPILIQHEMVGQQKLIRKGQMSSNNETNETKSNGNKD